MSPDDPKAIIRDLLKIVRVAMPDDLYALDIRVARAEAYLEERPPSSRTVLGMPAVASTVTGRKPKPKGEA